jgi:threonine 3-dehydrogenase
MAKTMKALVKAKPEPGVWIEEVPVPEIGPTDVLIKIRKTAICGTDVHIYSWDEWSQRTIPVPMTIGHEYVGDIVAVGEEVEDFEPGDRVSGEGHIVCGHCRNCRAGREHLCRDTMGVGVNRPGAFAEYLAIPAHNAYKLPAELPDEIAAILDPLGNATHTALSFDLVGEDVLITGAGPIGIMAGAIAKKIGARHIVITDINPYRLALARKLGLDHAVDAGERKLPAVMDELGMLEGFDVGLEMSGSPRALNDMLSVMMHGGKVALLGIPPGEATLDLTHIIFKGLTLKGIYGREMFETWYKMIALIQSGLNLSGLITHRIDVEDYAEGFAAMLSGEAGKVVMNW